MEGFAAWKVGGRNDFSEFDWILPNVEEKGSLFTELDNPTSCPSDLILVGEFSELEGPVPLLTIPNNLITLHKPQPALDSEEHSVTRKLCQECLHASSQEDCRTAESVVPDVEERKEECILFQNTSFETNESSNQTGKCSCSLISSYTTIDNICSYNKSSSSRGGHYSCDTYVDRNSHASFICCSTHSHRVKHSCTCATKEDFTPSINMITHEQNPMYNGINVNDLILKLMSTDYQSTGGEFKVSSDTEVIEQDLQGKFSGIGAVIRYITLYDAQARGFVRPLCIAYLTWDRLKITHRLEAIRSRLRKASDHLKVCNLSWFGWEILERLADLHLTKERYIAALQATGYPNCNDCLPTRTCSKCTACGVTSDPEKINKTIKKSKSIPDVNDGIFKMAKEASINFSNDRLNESNNTPKDSQSSPDLTVIIHDRRASATSDKSKTVPTDYDLLQHTTLSNIATQILDCRKMISVVREYLTENKTLSNMKSLVSSICTERNSLLYSLLREWNVLHGTYVTTPSQEETLHPTTELGEQVDLNLRACFNITKCSKSCIATKLEDFLNDPSQCFRKLVCAKPFLMTVSRRKYKEMRNIKTLSGPGFLASVSQLMKLHESQKISGLSLLFQKIDKSCYSNDPGTLFIGNIPAVNVINCSDYISEHSPPESLVNSQSSNYTSPNQSVHSQSGSLTPVESVRKGVVLFEPRSLYSILSVLWSDPCVAGSDSYSRASKKSSDALLICRVCHKCIVCVNEQRTDLRAQNDFLFSSSNLPMNRDGRLVVSSCESNEQSCSTYASDSTYVKDARKLKRANDKHGALTKDTLHVLTNNCNSLGRRRVNGTVKKSNASKEVKYKYHPKISVEERISNAIKHSLASCLLSPPTSLHSSSLPSVSISLLVSLLSGRRLIVAARPNKQRAAESYVLALASGCLPVAQDNIFPITRYHRGTITSHHLHQQPLMGVCIPERLDLKDLMDDHTLKTVTVVNQSTGHVSGVSYSGKFLRGFKEFQDKVKLKEPMQPVGSDLLVSKPGEVGKVRKQSSLSEKVREDTSSHSFIVRSVSSPNIDTSELDRSFCLNPSTRFDTQSIENYIPRFTCQHICNEDSAFANMMTQKQSYVSHQPNVNAPFQSFLQSQFVRLGLKVYLYYHVCGNSMMEPQKLMGLLGVEERNDRKVLEYLTSIICRQIDLAEVDVEYKP